MIEITVADYLKGVLSVPVSLEVPEKVNKYIVVEKTGSSERNYIYSATIAVQSVAESLYEAAALNEEVKSVMREIEALDEVSECTLNSDYNFTDTTTKKYRYQAIFDIVHY